MSDSKRRTQTGRSETASGLVADRDAFSRKGPMQTVEEVPCRASRAARPPPRAIHRRSQPYDEAMVTAIVFVKAEVAKIPEVAEAIAALPGVSEVYSVTGAIDLIVIVRVSSHDQVAEVVADRLNKVTGVLSTETHIAFRAYSQHDLEAAFSLGG